MTTWQKVRVTFNDADGNEVSAVMWQDVLQGACVDRKKDTLWVGWNLDYAPKVTPIRELPTGVGAVIRVNDYGRYMKFPYDDLRDIFISDPSGRWWSNTDGDVCPDTQMDDWQYEILSEGIQL